MEKAARAKDRKTRRLKRERSMGGSLPGAMVDAIKRPSTRPSGIQSGMR